MGRGSHGRDARATGGVLGAGRWLEGEGLLEEVVAEECEGHFRGAVADHFAVAGEVEGAGGGGGLGVAGGAGGVGGGVAEGDADGADRLGDGSAGRAGDAGDGRVQKSDWRVGGRRWPWRLTTGSLTAPCTLSDVVSDAERFGLWLVGVGDPSRV